MSDDKRLDKTADLLKALAHPTRMRIVQLQTQHGELSVSTVVNELNLEQSLVSHHLAKMLNKRLLVNRRQGKQIWYSLADSVLSAMMDLATQ